MFTCSNCGHKINAPESRLPPFCPRCGAETGAGSNPFADSLVDDDEALPQLSDLPDLPPPPPMDSLPVSREHGRSGPSKTLFGMPGVNPDELQLDDPLPSPPAKPAPPLAKPAPAPAAKPAPPPTAKPAPPPIKPAPPTAAKPTPPPLPAKPAPAVAKPPAAPPPKPAAAAPPPPAKPATPPKPPLPGAVPVPKPAAPAGSSRVDAPARPAARTPSGPGRPAPALPAESGSFAMDESGAFEKDDPFFTGDPDELPELGSITDGQILARRPSSGPVKAAEPIGLGGGVGSMQEFEFEGGGSLELGELDLPSGGADIVDLPAAGTSRDLVEFDGIEMPVAGGDLDLPSPVADATDGLDLPLPTGRHDDLDLDGFGPPGELDLPLPSASFELDPAPVAAPPAKPVATPPAKPVATPPAKPAAATAAAPSKPAAAPPSKPAAPSKPATSTPAPLSLPEFADDLDLPTPSADLPGPVDDFPGFTADSGLELEDLPLPADELPTPAGELPASASLSKSSGNLPMSSGELPTPIDALGLDLDDEPSPPARKPAPTPAPTPAAKPIEVAAPIKAPEPPKAANKSPAPKPEQRSPVRAIVYGTLGVVVVAALVGVYGMGAGWFDEDIPLPPASQNDSPDPQPQPPSNVEITERSEAILAKFDEDSPAAYVQVLDGLAQDGVAQAEAALLLHLRYGPDPERLARAGQLLDAHAENPAPHVRRVLGLALLGQPARRAESLTWFGDDPRSQLYRAWALRDSDPAAARTAAEAAAKARPNDKAVALLLAELELQRDSTAGLAALRKLADSDGQPSAKLALVEALRSEGLLAEAATIAAKLSGSSVSAGHKGEQLRLRAELALAQGNMAEALRLLDQAIATDASSVAPRIDKVELALALRDLPTARSESDVLLRERPQDREVMMLVARVAIEAGRDDDANAQLSTLGGPESTDPNVHALYGELAALLLDVEAARKAWAKARELDPLRIATVAAEVELLIKVEQGDAALALLDEQKTKLAAREDHETMPVRAALAQLERTRARLLRSRGEPGPALTAAEEASKLDPRDNAARLLRAELLAAVGNVEASEEAIEQLYARTGGYPGLTNPLGRMLLRKGKLDELDTLIGAQLEASEASVELLMTGAALRLAQNKPDQAKLLAERVLDRDSTALQAHLLLGRALLALGEYGAALDEIEAAQAREPNAEVELWMGQALEYNGRAVEARPRYKKALEIEPGNLEAAALLGRLYAYEGAAKAALELLEPVVQKTDAYPYAYLAIAIAHRDLGKRDQAVGEFQRARELDPTLFEAYYEEGRILNDSNKHASAASALQAGLDNAKANALPRQLEDAWRRLGDSYFELGRKADAKAAFDEYLKLAAPNAPGRAEVMRQMKSL